jgi:hypothetical protein
MSNINVRLEDISNAIREIKQSKANQKENKIKEFERKLNEDATMLKDHPKIQFEFVDMLTTTVSRVYSDNNNDDHDKKKLDAIIEQVFPDEEMRGGKKTKKRITKRTRKRITKRTRKRITKRTKKRITKRTKNIGGGRDRKSTDKGKAYQVSKQSQKKKLDTRTIHKQNMNDMTNLFQGMSTTRLDNILNI